MNAADDDLMKSLLTQRALSEGFCAIGITKPNSIAHHAPKQLAHFIAQDWHGQMSWMQDRMGWRANPSELWPEVRSIIMLAESYRPDENPLSLLKLKNQGVISAYARGKDYHDLVKKRLKRLGRWLIDEARTQGKECDIKVFVDTAPVMEKPLAQAAGLGWQGKHTNLLSRQLGNWFFLGAIFTTLDLAQDEAETSHCGSCRACLDICPTNAFPAPYQLDARRCISYLTIEHKGPVDPRLRPLLGNRIYGCDDCLAVCPWNKFAQQARETGYEHKHTAPPLDELAQLSDQSFRERFRKSPIKRIGRNRFVRNVLYAIGNSGKSSKQAHFIEIAQNLSLDLDETVADAARWALRELQQKK